MQQSCFESYLKDGEIIDDLQLKGLKIIQNRAVFSFGIDAVLLSSIVCSKEGDNIIDIGCGNGILPILLSAKIQASKIYGVEIQPCIADMADRSVKMNKLEDKVVILNADIRDIAKYYSSQFDVVVSNPPYFKAKSGMMSDNSSKMLSRHEINLNLDELYAAAKVMLKNRGKMYLIHRPSRLVDIFFYARKHYLEPKNARLVVSKTGEEPKLVLLELVKNGGSELKWQDNLIVYNDDGSYSDEIKYIYSSANITSFSDKHPL